MQVVDLVGQKFGKLTVLGRSSQTSLSGAMWRCVCTCGATADVASLKLRRGKTKSCGCHRAAATGDRSRTHGMSKNSRTYRTWKEMRQRCNNPNSDGYRWYGAKGVSICPRWDSYALFLADMGERPEGKTLDRIDARLGYEPGNCQWLVPLEQTRKQEKNILRPVVDEVRRGRAAGLSCATLARKYGVSRSTVHRCVTGRTWGSVTPQDD